MILYFRAVKNIACILSIIFLLFVAGPTIISLIDDSVDMSYAFTANEHCHKVFLDVLSLPPRNI